MTQKIMLLIGRKNQREPSVRRELLRSELDYFTV
jgi:hypothetical protein